MKFGEYLRKKGKIDETDLDAALQLQTERSVRLGSLAVEAGILTEQQLSVILDHQREIEEAGLFGEIAVNMKFLSKEQLDKLFKEQKDSDKIIGEIFVLNGVLCYGKMEEKLKLFRKSSTLESRF